LFLKNQDILFIDRPYIKLKLFWFFPGAKDIWTTGNLDNCTFGQWDTWTTGRLVNVAFGQQNIYLHHEPGKSVGVLDEAEVGCDRGE
jgi:hypothetical protein